MNEENNVEPKKTIPTPETLRTYESDIAKVLAQKQTSVASIAIAESKKREGVVRLTNQPMPETKKGFGRNIFLALLSIIFIGAGVYGAYYFYIRSPFAQPAPIVQDVRPASIIPSDVQSAFLIDKTIEQNSILPRIASILNKMKIPQGKIGELIIGELIASEMGDSKRRITTSEFIQKIAIKLPSILERSLTERFMLGTYNDPDSGNTPFIVLTTDFFQNAFAGMLEWEDSMADDLSILLDFKTRAQQVSLTASSSISSYFGIRGQFADKTLRNRDVREFTSQNGELLFLYSFIDKNSLIITTTEQSLVTILDRIEKQAYMR